MNAYVSPIERANPGSPSFVPGPDVREDFEKLKDALEEHERAADAFRKISDDQSLDTQSRSYQLLFGHRQDRYFSTKEDLKWHVENVTCISPDRLMKALSA